VKYLFAVLREMRIHQYTKNILVFAGLLFGGKVFQTNALLPNFLMFAAFCFTASGIYFMNDLLDIEKDQKDPKKSKRPIAAGEISQRNAAIISISLLMGGILLALQISVACTSLLLSYIVVNLFYSFCGKHIVILDIMLISYGFVIRAVSGVVAIESEITTWFLLCIMFLSLFLALGKRRNEFCVMLMLQKERNSADGYGRKVLRQYNLPFIDSLLNIVTAAALVCYALFAMEAREKMGFLFTIPIVAYGLFYYLYIIYAKGEGGAPDELLYKDRTLVFIVLVYFLVVFFIRNVRFEVIG